MGNICVAFFKTARIMKAFAVLLALLPLARSQNYYYKPYPDPSNQARRARSNPPPPPPSYAPAPAPYAPAPSYPAVYDFAWDVLDTYSGNDFGHQESRNEALTTGSYHVALPDGRVQTVTYTVDGYGGYAAEVTYAGEAAYPDTPAYKPAPVVVKAAPAEPAQPAVKVSEPVPAPTYAPVTHAPVVYKPAPAYKPAPVPAPGYTARRYSYKVVEPEAPAAEESRSVAGRPVANIIQASAEKEVEEEQELAAAITEIEANDSAQSVELVEEEEEEPVAVTQATPASYYY